MFRSQDLQIWIDDGTWACSKSNGTMMAYDFNLQEYPRDGIIVEQFSSSAAAFLDPQRRYSTARKPVHDHVL